MQRLKNRKETDWIIVRGGGDLATGAVQRLHRAGFPVVVLETHTPLAIRRHVALSEAVTEKSWTVEDITARLAATPEDIPVIQAQGDVPVFVDPEAALLQSFRPLVVVDAILAKKNLGTTKDMGRAGTIALGPGFVAGADVDIVIETMRGHHLGRLIFSGEAAPNTGTPGVIAGVDRERVIHAPASGILRTVQAIGEVTKQGEPITYIGETPVPATIDGILRGLLEDGMRVEKGLKMADIDPRLSEQANCYTISEKARNLGGSVLEAVMILCRRA